MVVFFFLGGGVELKTGDRRKLTLVRDWFFGTRSRRTSGAEPFQLNRIKLTLYH